MPPDSPLSFCTSRGSAYKRSVPMLCSSMAMSWLRHCLPATALIISTLPPSFSRLWYSVFDKTEHGVRSQLCHYRIYRPIRWRLRAIVYTCRCQARAYTVDRENFTVKRGWDQSQKFNTQIKHFTQKNFEDRTEPRKFINAKFFYARLTWKFPDLRYTFTSSAACSTSFVLPDSRIHSYRGGN